MLQCLAFTRAPTIALKLTDNLVLWFQFGGVGGMESEENQETPVPQSGCCWGK